jgi:class 3 adenylate cyclase
MNAAATPDVMHATSPLPLDETRQVSILFADIVGSTKLICDLDAEDARNLLDQAINDIKEAVHMFGGVIARIQGDGVMAMFGVMSATEDHAQRATFAALHIRDKAQRNSTSAQTPLSLRVGVHSGPIFLRWQDNDFGRVLDAVGSAAHVAARVEQLCPPNSATISRATLELLTQPVAAHFVNTVARDESNVRLEVFELSDNTNGALSENLASGRWMNPLIGRTQQISALRSHIRALVDGHGGCMGILGDAGIGKSRILYECTLIAEHMHVQHRTLRGSEILLNRPFGALFPLLQRMILDAVEGNPDDAVIHMENIGLSKAEAEALCNLIACNGRDEIGGGISQPDERHRLITNGSIKLLLAQSAIGPFLLLVDDVQYLDGETRILLSRLTKAQPYDGFAIIMAGRNDAAYYLNAYCNNVAVLSALDSDQTQELITSILLSNPAAKDLIGSHLIEEIAIRADGLPLAIEEFSAFAVRMKEDDKITGPLRLPPRLENIFRSRIESLPDGARELCEICCVMGAAVSLAHLLRITNDRGILFEQDFQALLSSKILTFEMSGRLRFSHQLFQEAGYQAIPKERRKMLHAEIYSLLSPEAQLASISQQELARHAKEGGRPAHTLKHLWKACEEAVAHAAIESVFNIYTEAKSVCAQMGDEAQTWSSRFALLAFDAAQQMARQDKCREDIAAIADGRVVINNMPISIAKTHLAMTDWIEGRGVQARIFAEAACEELGPDAHLPLISYAQFTLGNTEFATGDPVRGFDRLVTLINKLSDGMETATFGSMISVPGIMARSFASWYGTDLGHYDQASLYARQCRDLAEQIDHVYSRLLSRLAEGYLLLRQRRLEDATEILTEGRALCAANKFYGLETMGASWLSMCLIERGKIFQAQKIIDHCFNNVDVRSVQNSCNYYLHESKARLYFACGEEEEALLVAEAAAQRCSAQGDLVHAAYGRAVVGEFQVQLPQYKQAGTAALNAVRKDALDLGLTPLCEHIIKLSYA